MATKPNEGNPGRGQARAGTQRAKTVNSERRTGRPDGTLGAQKTTGHLSERDTSPRRRSTGTYTGLSANTQSALQDGALDESAIVSVNGEPGGQMGAFEIGPNEEEE